MINLSFIHNVTYYVIIKNVCSSSAVGSGGGGTKAFRVVQWTGYRATQ